MLIFAVTDLQLVFKLRWKDEDVATAMMLSGRPRACKDIGLCAGWLASVPEDSPTCEFLVVESAKCSR